MKSNFFYYKIFPKKDIIVEYYKGKFTIDDFIHCKDILRQNPNYNFDLVSILDFRDVTYNIDLHSKDFKKFTDYKRNNFPYHKKRTVAYITSDPNVYALTLLYDEFLNQFGLNQDGKILSTTEATMRWLGDGLISKEILDSTINELKLQQNLF